MKLFNYTEDDLSLAIDQNNTKKAIKILNKLPNNSFQYNHCTRSAILGNSELISILLLDPRCTPQNNLNEPLFKSIEHNNYDCFKLLIKDKRILSSFNELEILKESIRSKNTEIFDYLIDIVKINPFQQKNLQILKRTLMYESEHMTKKLIKHQEFNYQEIVLEINNAKFINIFLFLFQETDFTFTTLFLDNYATTIIENALPDQDITRLKILYNNKEMRQYLIKKNKNKLIEKIHSKLLISNIKNF